MQTEKRSEEETSVMLGHTGDLNKRKEKQWFETFTAVKRVWLTERK